MAAVYDVQVKNQLCDYEKSLSKYPIRASRRKVKVSSLRTFLQQLSKNVLSYPICDKKKLGQVFSPTDEPLDKNLRQTNYQDESGTQWSISFFQVSKNTVKIYRLYQTSYVSETISRNKTIIRLNESDLYRMVKESVKRILTEKKEDVTYKPIGPKTFYTNNGKTKRKSVVTLQAPSGQVCHIAEDDHCYVLFNGSGIEYGGNGLRDKNCEMIHHIFPEAFKALKDLPLL